MRLTLQELEEKLKRQGYLNFNDGLMYVWKKSPKIKKYLDKEYNKPSIFEGLKKKVKK